MSSRNGHALVSLPCSVPVWEQLITRVDLIGNLIDVIAVRLEPLLNYVHCSQRLERQILMAIMDHVPLNIHKNISVTENT